MESSTPARAAPAAPSRAWCRRRGRAPACPPRRPPRSAAASSSRVAGGLARPCHQKRSATPGLLERVAAVGAGHLAAQPRRGHHLARDCASWSGSNAQRSRWNGAEVGVVEHRRHVALLVHAHAVLAGDRAAGVHARLHDQAGQLLGALGLARLARRRSRRAGAGCRRRRGRRSPPGGRTRPPARRSGRAPRRAACAGSRCPARSSSGAIRPIAANAALRARPDHGRARPRPCATRIESAPASSQHRHDLLEARLALGLRAVQLDHERRAGVGRVAGARGALGGADREVVHHLDRARARCRRPRSSTPPRRPARSSRRRPRACAPPRASGTTRSQIFVAMPSVPSEPTNAPDQVVARAVELLAAERDQRCRRGAPARARSRSWW